MEASLRVPVARMAPPSVAVEVEMDIDKVGVAVAVGVVAILADSESYQEPVFLADFDLAAAAVVALVLLGHLDDSNYPA